MNQQLRATVPKGLSQLSAATLTKQSAAGLSTPIVGLQLLTDSSTGLPYWSYHNSRQQIILQKPIHNSPYNIQQRLQKNG